MSTVHSNEGTFGTVSPFWEEQAHLVLLDPRIAPSVRARVIACIAEVEVVEPHIWVASSGTTAAEPEEIRLIALSREAMMASAHGVNVHLQVSKNDAWISALPDFHVGGFSIHARAFKAGIGVIRGSGNIEKWNARAYKRAVESSGATLSALVPTQLFDLVRGRLRAPKCLRAIVIGGGALDGDLYARARTLGWPVLTSYGLTECASQVATASLDSLTQQVYPELKVLSHVELSINEGQISIRSKALFTCHCRVTTNGCTLEYPTLTKGWFRTSDYGEYADGVVRVLGRAHDFIKVGGEGVNLGQLDQVLSGIFRNQKQKGDAALVAIPNERLGHLLALAVTKTVRAEELENEFNSQVLPFSRVRGVVQLPEIPRSPLGKVLRQKLMDLVKLDG